jgi:hypothetical protein
MECSDIIARHPNLFSMSDHVAAEERTVMGGALLRIITMEYSDLSPFSTDDLLNRFIFYNF